MNNNDLNNNELIKGFINAVHRERFQVVTSAGELYARLKTGIYYKENSNELFPTVGDNVLLQYNPNGDCLIVKTEERKSWFSRLNPTPGMGEQVVAANFDYVFIMMSLNYDFNLKRMERYLTAAWQSGGVPVVILTKADIGEEIESKMEAIKEITIGVDVYTISSVSGEGIEALEKYLQPDKTIVFLGSSGVGKSTFTNLLLGEQAMKTNTIREEDSKGHHTTTYRQLFILPNGAKVIDTPGMRELGMWDVTEGLGQSFEDVEEMIAGCKFYDCSHGNEPGCAIRKALENGTLTADRWKSYNKLKKEAKFSDAKVDRARERKATGKKISKMQKQYHKTKGNSENGI